MVEQGLDVGETLAGLEAAAKVRTVRGASLSREDSAYLNRHGFFGNYTVTVFTPDEIAEMFLFLASGRSAWVTGQVFHVNGGRFMS